MPLIVSGSAQRLYAALGQLHELARGGREMGVRRVMNAYVAYIGGSNSALCRLAREAAGLEHRGRCRSCRRSRARRGRARRSGTRPRSGARPSRPPAARAPAARGGWGRLAPAGVGEDQRRLGELLDRDRRRDARAGRPRGTACPRAWPRGRQGRRRRRGARSGRPRARRRGRRRRPRRCSGRRRGSARPGAWRRSPGSARRSGSGGRWRRCRTRPSRPSSRAPRGPTAAPPRPPRACARRGEQEPARLGQLEALARADEQRDAELGLQPAHLLGQARLGHQQLVRGRRERSVARCSKEIRQLLKGQALPIDVQVNQA